MTNLGSVLNQLLNGNENVGLPGLGVFRAHYKSAELPFAEKSIFPPDKTIEFYPAETSEYDEVLPAYLTSQSGMSREVAYNTILEFTSKVKAELAQQPEAWIEGFGTLAKDYEGNVFFKPSESISYHFDSFGLKPLAAESLYSRNRQTIDREVPVIPLHPFDSGKETEPEEGRSGRGYLRWGAFGAVGAALILAVSGVFYLSKLPENGGVTSNSITRQEAGLVSVPLPSQPEVLPEESVAESPVPMAHSLPQELPAENSVTSTSAPSYYVIAGSFKEKERLAKIEAVLQKKGYQTSEHANEEKGMVRVAIGSFPDKEQALAFLHANQNQFSESLWVYAE